MINELINRYEYETSLQLKEGFRTLNKINISMGMPPRMSTIQDVIDYADVISGMTRNPITRWKIRKVINGLKKKLEVSIDE